MRPCVGPTGRSKLNFHPLTRINIPDSKAKGPDLGDHNNPKTWKGPWVTVTNPTEIATIVKQTNIQQYHQAFQTPFGSGPLADKIGWNGFSPMSQVALNGEVTESLVNGLLPETTRILHTLASSNPKLSQRISPSPLRNSLGCIEWPVSPPLLPLPVITLDTTRPS
jgi:hypothetical protein